MQKVRYISICLSLTQLYAHQGRDVIFEFKAAYFRPINDTFQRIYGGGAIFGPEVTFKMFRRIHGFVSYDYFTKNGTSLGLNSPTQVNFMPIAVGLKLMNRVSEHARLYAGLGFEPTYLRVTNCSPYVRQHMKKWGFGGIFKVGAYIDLPHNVLFDFFADYSFVKVASGCTNPALYTQATKSDLSGFIFGASLGYRFH